MLGGDKILGRKRIYYLLSSVWATWYREVDQFVFVNPTWYREVE